MRKHRGRHKSVKENGHILSLAFLAPVCDAVILFHDQLCRYQLDFLTDIFLSDDLHLTSAVWADLFVFGDSAGNDFCLDVLYYLITLGLCTFSDVALYSLLYWFFGLFGIFLFCFVEK